MSRTETASRVQYVYDFATLDRVPEGPTSLKVTAKKLLSGPSLQSGKSSTVGAVLSGEHIICTLASQAQGTGAKAHNHPNEQFNYILQGTMMSDIEGDRVFASKGMILHTPGSVVHTGLACPDEDLVFLAIKDTRHGIVWHRRPAGGRQIRRPELFCRLRQPVVFVVEGELEAQLEDEELLVRERCLLHVPAGARHALNAPRGAVVVIALD